jgi:glycosyltransferase involved in cell wall biosynthesis
VIALEVAFWASVALIAYTHVGYPVALRMLVGRRRLGRTTPPAEPYRPRVSLVIAAHDEEAAIESKLANALSLDYPRPRLEVVVASDGSTDATVAVAHRFAESDSRVVVLDLPRAGKVPAQDSAVEAASGEVLAFSDANALWEKDALEALVQRLAEPGVGYVCGRLTYTSTGANQEGAYWRYETATRELESRLASITAGNGAIYAVRRDAYLRLDPRTSHDLSFPFNLVKRGWRAVYEPRARAVERALPTTEGEFRRKRRMMAHAWPSVIAGGMLDPRGYGVLYGWEMLSHRVLRYATPLLHLVALGANTALIGRAPIYAVTLAAQAALLGLAAVGAVAGGRFRLAALCYYYVLVTASVAAGLWDWLRRGTPTTWDRAEGRG